MKKQVWLQFIWVFFFGAISFGVNGKVQIGGDIDGTAGEYWSGWSMSLSSEGDGIADTSVIEGLEKYGNSVAKIYNLSQRLLFSAHYGGPDDAWGASHEGRQVTVDSYVGIIDNNESILGHEVRMIYVNYCSIRFSKIPKKLFDVPILRGLGTSYWIFHLYGRF